MWVKRGWSGIIAVHLKSYQCSAMKSLMEIAYQNANPTASTAFVLHQNNANVMMDLKWI